MKAIRVHRFGGPEVLQLDELPDPRPGPGQVVVRVRAAGVNPVDTYIRNGKYASLPTLPYIPGTDAAGGTVSRGAVDARVDAVVWPMNGMLERPTGFEALGGLSSPGPLWTVVALVTGGAVLILGGAAYGPVAKRAAESRARRGTEAAGGR